MKTWSSREHNIYPFVIALATGSGENAERKSWPDAFARQRHTSSAITFPIFTGASFKLREMKLIVYYPP